MIDRARDGYNVVFGQRRKRKEHVLKRAGYWTFYRLVALLSDIRIPVDTGDFCLMDRRGSWHCGTCPSAWISTRLRAWVGFRQIGVEYDRPQRQAGISKYPLSKLYRLATDGIAAASIRPLKIAQLSCFLFGLVAILLMLVFILMLAGQLRATLSLPFLLTSLLIASGHALTMLCLYVFSAYLGRMYLEVKGRPPYIIMEEVARLEDTKEGPRK